MDRLTRRGFLKYLTAAGAGIYFLGCAEKPSPTPTPKPTPTPVSTPKATPKPTPAPTFPIPGKTLRWIVPYKPGGGYDTYSRMLAPLLAEMLELPLRIENLPKGEGAQGYKELINSKPDGHTIGIYNPGHISNSRDITGIYDFNTIDMTFLYQITDEPSVVTIYTGEESKFSSFEELYEYSREKPVRAATTSGTSKIGPILMKVLWGMNLVFVPFASSTEGRAALMRGDVELSVYSIGSSLEAVSASKDLKVGLIISGKKSASEIDVVPVYEKLYDISLADVPTSAGLNLPSNDDMAAVVSAYRTIIGPPKMPAEIANKVMDAFDRLFEEYKDTLDRLQKKWNRPLSGLARGDIPKERQMRAFEVLKQYRDLMVG